jgi:hypothetical protein
MGVLITSTLTSMGMLVGVLTDTQLNTAKSNGAAVLVKCVPSHTGISPRNPRTQSLPNIPDTA